MTQPICPLPWLEPGDLFPPLETAWPKGSEAPGLLAVGGDLSVHALIRAYSAGVFPWFSEGQPILWWSPDPRMVLDCANFKLHRSFRRTLTKFVNHADCNIKIDTSFERVVEACANQSRKGQRGTWILPEMVSAYIKLYHAGYAHSVETWVNGELVGGLYCVVLGGAVFGESMFTHVTDGSKIALAGLIAFCREHQITQIDCQQKTAHLTSMGASEISRSAFMSKVVTAKNQAVLAWNFSPLYWENIFSCERVDCDGPQGSSPTNIAVLRNCGL